MNAEVDKQGADGSQGERPQKQARTEANESPSPEKSREGTKTGPEGTIDGSEEHRSDGDSAGISAGQDLAQAAMRAAARATDRAAATMHDAEEVENDDEDDDDEDYVAPVQKISKKKATQRTRRGGRMPIQRRRGRRSAAEAMPTLSRLQWWTGRFVKQVLPIRGDASGAYIGDPGPSVVMVRGAPGVYVHRTDVPQRRVIRPVVMRRVDGGASGSELGASESKDSSSESPAKEPDIVVLHTSTGVAVPASPVIGHGKPQRGFMAGIIIDADVAFRRSYDDHQPQLVEVESVFQLFPSRSVLIVQGRVSSAQTAAQVADYALLELIRTGVCPFKTCDEVPFSTRAAEAVGRAMFYELYEQGPPRSSMGGGGGGGGRGGGGGGGANADGGMTQEEMKAVHSALVRQWKLQMTEDRSRSVMVDNSAAGVATRVALAAQAQCPTGGIQQTDLTYSAVAMADGGTPLCGQGASLLPLIEQANMASVTLATQAEAAASQAQASTGSAAGAATSAANSTSDEAPQAAMEDGTTSTGSASHGGDAGTSQAKENILKVEAETEAGKANADSNLDATGESKEAEGTGGGEGEYLLPATVVATGFDSRDYAQVAADAGHLALIRSGAVEAADRSPLLTDEAHAVAQRYARHWPGGKATAQAETAAAAANEQFIHGGSAAGVSRTLVPAAVRSPARADTARADTASRSQAGTAGPGTTMPTLMPIAPPAPPIAGRVVAIEIAAGAAQAAATAVMAARRAEGTVSASAALTLQSSDSASDARREREAVVAAAAAAAAASSSASVQVGSPTEATIEGND